MRKFTRALRFLFRGVWFFMRVVGVLFYGVGIFFWRLSHQWGLIRRKRLPCGVWSIGNMVLGGSGKTPAALWLIQTLRARGVSVAYLSRGYGRKTKGFHWVAFEEGAASTYSDEALMVKSRFPEILVAVSENRYEGGKKILEKNPEIKILILDDAFQHRKLHRDVDILVVDGTRPPWRSWLFPLGDLREPWSWHRRASWAMVNGKSQLSAISLARLMGKIQVPAAAFRYEAVCLVDFWTGESHSLGQFIQKPFLAFCGIAASDSFRATLRQEGLYMLDFVTFRDHAEYSMRRVRYLQRRYQHLKRKGKSLVAPIALITTEKDAVRLRYARQRTYTYLEGIPFYYLRIEMAPLDDKAEEFVEKGLKLQRV
ncbi:MAG: tetraacyldisaccharide 4'-kinase [Bacteroidia bacterium]